MEKVNERTRELADLTRMTELLQNSLSDHISHTSLQIRKWVSSIQRSNHSRKNLYETTSTQLPHRASSAGFFSKIMCTHLHLIQLNKLLHPVIHM